ncbi:MAG: translocation/assembly module TamB domain-containing protein, partial [Bacteroidales bacterium]|nr:translocation/assembly module TamB domain-containing protein [Bacteroidales bacterium]
VPKYKFNAKIKDAALYTLNLSDRDSTMSLSTNLDINFMGTRPDNMQGMIEANETVYKEQGKQILMDNLSFSVTGDTSGFRVFRLFSDFVDASLEGESVFRDLPGVLLKTVDIFLDTLSNQYDTATFERRQDFVYDVNIKNAEPVTALFLPDIEIAQNSLINGSFNSSDLYPSVSVNSDYISYRNFKLENWNMNIERIDNSLDLSLFGKKLFISDTLNIDSLVLHTEMNNDSILFDIDWKGYQEANKHDINGFIYFMDTLKYKVRLNRAKLKIGKQNWSVTTDNYVIIDSSGILFNNVGLSSDEEMIMVTGSVSDNPMDTLQVSFDDFDITSLDFILKNLNIKADGYINGNSKLTGFRGSPNIISDIAISDFYFNGEKLGDANFVTSWNRDLSALDLLAEIVYTGNIGSRKTLYASGTYKPQSNKDNFDIDITLDNYKLKTIEPFLRSFSSDFSGMASGLVHMGGSTNSPVFEGDLSLIRSRLKIDYLNVTYYFADKVDFRDNMLNFSDIVIYDSLNNQGVLNGHIDFNKLSDIGLDLNISLENLLCMNTSRTMNDMFYGNAFSTGDFKISGPVSDLNLEINIMSENGTSIVIPVSYALNVTDNDFIVFIDKDQGTLIDSPVIQSTQTGLSMNFNLNVTPDAKIEIILPYDMGRLNSTGSGDLNMNIDPSGNFTMDGEYEIRKGSFFFTLQNIINRYFDINRGGKISWNGDPFDADINMRAVYKLKTSLGAYAPGGDSATRVPVDCVISLRNKLSDPEFKFTIEFPDLNEDSKQYVYARLDTNDQAEMNQQMVSLLILNSFSYGSVTSSGVGFNTFSLLSNQINNWLSNISEDFDIGINYRPGDDISQHEVEVALSTQLFDDRVSIDGNVGVRGDQPTNTSTENTNNIVGEVTVVVRVTEDGNLRVKAFNKSNNSYLSRNYAMYTQGVGIFYTQDFNKISEIFR